MSEVLWMKGPPHAHNFLSSSLQWHKVVTILLFPTATLQCEVIVLFYRGRLWASDSVVGSCCSCLPSTLLPPSGFSIEEHPLPHSRLVLVQGKPDIRLLLDIVFNSSGISWPKPGQPEPMSIFGKFAKCLGKWTLPSTGITKQIKCEPSGVDGHLCHPLQWP